MNDQIVMKTCTLCNKEKKITAFWKRDSICGACRMRANRIKKQEKKDK